MGGEEGDTFASPETTLPFEVLIEIRSEVLLAGDEKAGTDGRALGADILDD